MTAATGQRGAGAGDGVAEGSPPRRLRDEILAQPGNLERAAATFLPALRRAEPRRHGFDADPLVFTGMGASLFAAIPAALALRAAGRPALALPATEVLGPGGALADLGAAYVGVSQSGRSAETLAALRAVDAPRLALTNATGSPLADLADLVVPLGSAPDAGISVLTYTASLLAGAALASALVGGTPEVDVDVGGLAAAMAELLGRADAAAARLAARLGGARVIDLVGQEFSSASAGYGALLLREAARVPTASFDTRQYLHGPVEVAEDGVGAVLLGAGREVPLAGYLAAAGVAVLLVTAAGVRPPQGVEAVALPDVPAPLRPLLEAVPLQLLADHLAAARGLVPGGFRHYQRDTKVEPP